MRNFTIDRSDTRTKTKRWLGLLTFCMMLLMGQSVLSQTYYTIGTSEGTNSSTQYPSPLGDYYENQRSQTIYLASDLTAAGLTSGFITHLRWNIIDLQGAGLIENFSIKLGTTSDTSLGQSANSWITTTEVFGPVDYLPVVGENVFDITDFVWDGVSNIVVEVCSGKVPSNDGVYYTNNPAIAYQTMPYNVSLTYRVDNATTSTCNYSGAPTVSSGFVYANRRPLIDFGWLPLPDCSGTPNGGVASASPNNGNPDSVFSVNVSGSTAAEGLSYQWEISLDNVVWDEINGETSPVLITTAPTIVGTTVYYRRKTTCTTSNESDYSSVAQFTTTLTYCTSEPSSLDHNGISNVTLNSVSFPVGVVTYYNYTDSVIDITPGLMNEFFVNFETNYSYHINVWIDFNDNGEFDSDELVYQGESVQTGTSAPIIPYLLDATFYLNVSTANQQGVHKMRIGTADTGQSTPNPCYNGTYGVTIDLMVNVLPLPLCVIPIDVEATNMTHYSADLSWVETATATTWDIEYGLSGFIPTGTPMINVTASPYTLSGLSAYTEYEFYLRSNCGLDGVGPWVGPFSFKTAFDCTSYAGEITSTTGGDICVQGTTTLQATASGLGDAIYWYDAESGGNLVGIGNSFETPELTSTTSFWTTEVELGTELFTGQGNLNATTLSSTTNGGITFVLNKTASIISFEARSTTAAGGAVTYALIDVNNNNSVLMTHDDTLPGGGTATSPVLYTVQLNFNNIPPGTYRLIKQSGAASAYMTGAFPYPLGTVGEVITGAGSATSTSTLYYHFFNITIEGVEVLCESEREEVVATVHIPEEVQITSTAVPTNAVAPGDSTTLTATSTNDPNYTYTWEPAAYIAGSNTGATISTTALNDHTVFTVTATDTVTGCTTSSEIEVLVFDITQCDNLEITSTTGGSICNQGTVTLHATASGTGENIYWYDAAVGGNKVGEGSAFDTPILTETTSFWASEIHLGVEQFTGQGNTSATTLGSTTNGGITFELYETASIVSFEARSTSAAGGAVTYALIDVNNGNSVLMTHDDTLPAGGTPTSPVLYTVQLNFNNIPPGTYRLIKQSGAASAYMTGAFPYPLGNLGQVTTGAAGATSTSTLYYHFFNITIESSKLLCESAREEVVAVVNGAAPLGEANQQLESGDTLADLDVTATGTLTWYTDDTLTTVIPDTTAAVNGTTYYVTQTIDGCESAPLAITTTVSLSFPAPYCNVSFPSDVEPITLVQFNTIDNASSATINGSPALENFTAISTDVMQTESYLITLKGNTGGNYINIFTVYIDWNQDGDFSDAGETYQIGQISNSSGLDNVSASGLITVPADATLGSTRMRVIKKFSVAADACNTLGYGQAEDYTINVLPPPPCLTPANLSAEMTSLTSVQISWNGTAASYDLEWGVEGFTQGSGTLVSDITTTSYVISSLTADTSYQFYVRQNCGTDGVSSWVGPYTLFVGYCQAGAVSLFDEKISNVTFQDINNSSTSSSGYEDFTAISTEVTQGESYNFSVTLSEYYDTDEVLVWIDFNQDGDFNDPGEAVLTLEMTSTSGGGNITIPMNATLGATRMRIRLHYADYQENYTPCGNSGYGQVEDYTVIIMPSCNLTTPTGATAQTLESGDTLADLDVTGDDLVWYADAALTTVLPSSTVAVDGTTYYVVSESGSCQSAALAITVTVTSVDPCSGITVPTGATAQTLELGDTLADLDVTGTNLVWYADAALTTVLPNSTVAVDGTTYYVVSETTDCQSAALAITVTVIDPCAGVTTPTGASTQTLNIGGTLADLDVTGTNLVWYADAALTTVLPNTTVAVDGTTYYVVSETGDCQSEALAITVTVIDPCADVTAPTGDTVQTVADGSTLADLTVNGTNLSWFEDADLTQSIPATTVVENGTTYYVASVTDVCVSEPLAITVYIEGVDPCDGVTVPAPTGEALQTVSEGTTLADLVVDGENLQWYADADLTQELDSTTVVEDGVTYYVTQTIGLCTSAEALEVTVQVTVGREDFDSFAFRFYPNPVGDVLNLTSNSEISNIDLFNMLGQKVTVVTNANNTQVDMSALPTGNYIISVTIEGVTKTFKVVKN